MTSTCVHLLASMMQWSVFPDCLVPAVYVARPALQKTLQDGKISRSGRAEEQLRLGKRHTFLPGSHDPAH